MGKRAVVAADLAELDDELAGLIRPHLGLAPSTLTAISQAIAAKRDEAVTARTSSGIETVWIDCEEAYIGIDNANRSEWQAAKWCKPMSMEGPVTSGATAKAVQDVKSTAFIRLTARYVDAGAAKLTEILLPANDKAFSFSEMPDPDLIAAKDNNSQVLQDGTKTPLMRPARPGEIPPPTTAAPQPPTAPVTSSAVSPAAIASPPATAPAASGAVLDAAGAGAPTTQKPPLVPLTVKDLAEENIEIARKSAKKAETRVYDWMVGSQYTAEMRKTIFDSSRIGVGVVKGPFPKASRVVATKKGDDGKSIKVIVEDKISPATKWIDPWKFYPDPACGENIQNGEYCFEQDFLSERQVRDLKRIPGYIADQIDIALEQGPTNDVTKSKNPSDRGGEGAEQTRFEVWYYYGALKRDEMDCMYSAARPGKSLKDVGIPADQDSVYAIVTMIGSTVVRASFNPLDSGAFPYHTMPWQRRAGHWAGIGVAEQCRMPQRTLNASTRAMLNNAGKSAGCQFIIDHAAIVPANGNWTIEPDKIWYKVGDSPGDDVRKAMLAIEIPNVTNELMVIVKYAMQLAEESTSIPLITQGQSGVTTPDTFGAAQLQDNNANQLLRTIGYTFDDNITEPLVRQYYEWLLLDPDVPDDEKGNFRINAHGSIALVEQKIQDAKIAQMSGIVLNPAYGFDPKRWAKMYCKSNKMDPADFQYTAEEQQRLDSAPPPKPPVVQAAEVAAAVKREAMVSAQTAEERSAENEHAIAVAANEIDSQNAQNDATRIAAEDRRTQAEATVRLHEIQMKLHVATLEYANRHGITLMQAKAQLAQTAMKLKVERDLNAENNAHDMHKHMNPQDKGDGKKPGKRLQPPHTPPAVQVPGRAANGQAESQVA